MKKIKRHINLCQLGIFTRPPCLALAAGFFGAVLIAPLTAAHANLITDGDFETTQLSADFNGFEYLNGTLNNWLYSATGDHNGALLINAASGAWHSSDQTGYSGNQFAGIQGTGRISQSFSPDSTGVYSVSWLDAGRSRAWGYDFGNQNYTASLYDETTGMLVEETSNDTTTDSTFSAMGFSGLLTAGDIYTLSFWGTATTDQTALIDNVIVEAVMATELPEPAALALFGTGLAGLGLIRRRRAI